MSSASLAASSESSGPGERAELLSEYRPGAFFLSSRHGTFLAEGVAHRAPSAEVPALAVSGLLAEAGADGMVVGAIPFDQDEPASLVVPRIVRRGPPPTGGRAGEPPPRRTPLRVREVPEPSGYTGGVRTALRKMASSELEKVVLARALEITARAPVSIGTVLRALTEMDPIGYTFAVNLGRSTLVGASPELLVSRRGQAVFVNPLAGSLPRDADPAVDGRNATELLRSAKNTLEHNVVVSAVVDGLRPLVAEIEISEPELLPTATMWHLSTRISGRLRDPDLSSLDLALALHPTPAVCGFPSDLARATISEIEEFDRGFYTGLVGWCDAVGDGEWVVAIRCGTVYEETVRLFAGAGIVPGSTPENELAETSAKFRTLLSALGLTGAELDGGQR